jgi:tRNA-guanine family transglycosylase
MTAATMISHHNVSFFIETMRRARRAIVDGHFGEFRIAFLEGLRESEIEGTESE